MDLKPGQALGSYRIEERLVSGGMARVYRARQASTGREVAIKVLPALQADAATIERFEREMRVLAGLQHPRILGLIDAGRQDGWHYLVLPLVRQGDLADLIARENGPLPLPVARRIALQLCEALEYAHAQGVVHRDLKPANVLRDDSGNVLLADFGIARSGDGARLTLAGQAIGTPEYLAPEQADGSADARSDLYALGLIVYEMLTGRLPFAATTAAEWLRAQREAPVPSPRTFNAQLPRQLEAFVLKALAKRPEERFQSAGEFAGALRDALPAAVYAEGALPLPDATRVLAPAASQRPRRRAPVVVGAAALLALAAFAVVFWRGSATNAGRGVVSSAGDAARVPAANGAVDEPTGPDATATPAPTPSATVPQAAAVAVVAPPPADAGGDVYDSFADARFDGRFDPTRWQLSRTDARTQFAQRGGALQVRSQEQQDGLYAEFAGTRLALVAARVRLLPPARASQGSVGVTISRADHAGSWVSCYVYAVRDAGGAAPLCTDQRRAEFRAGSSAALDGWHALEMNIDENRQRVLVAIDGVPRGELPLPGTGSTTWYVLLSGWSADAEPVAGEIADLRIVRAP